MRIFRHCHLDHLEAEGLEDGAIPLAILMQPVPVYLGVTGTGKPFMKVAPPLPYNHHGLTKLEW